VASEFAHVFGGFNATQSTIALSIKSMRIACLWPHWTHECELALYSFAAITAQAAPASRSPRYGGLRDLVVQAIIPSYAAREYGVNRSALHRIPD
jgi:hypothetical protein